MGHQVPARLALIGWQRAQSSPLRQTHFVLGLAVLPAVCGTIWSHNTAKSVPNGSGFDQKWLSKGPYAAGEMLAECIGYKNALCQPVSRTFFVLTCRGGWASFQCKILATACLCAVPFHGRPHRFMVTGTVYTWSGRLCTDHLVSANPGVWANSVAWP